MKISHAYKIKINMEFKNLIPPLPDEEYKFLEQSLVDAGCRDPICLWNGYILDGHNRYDICTQKGIPIQILDIELNSYEEAISWICSKQLSRSNISEETRKYLLGKKYEAEKNIGISNAAGCNQNSRKAAEPILWGQEFMQGKKNKTAERLGNEYHISHSTISKYGRYARALDTIAKREPEIANKILSGQIKLSHESVIALSIHPHTDMSKLNQHLSDISLDFVGYSETRKEIRKIIVHKRTRKPRSPALYHTTGSIKNMPAYDPDAEISSLALTIPSWVSTIARTRSRANLCCISHIALDKLQRQLVVLKKEIEDLQSLIREEDNNG